MKITLLLVSLFTFLPMWAALEKTPTQESEVTVYQEIQEIIYRGKADCAKYVYELVRDEIDNITLVNTSLSLYEQVMPVFIRQTMKDILKIGRTYCSETKLYEAAARIALEANDRDAMIVLSIAAEQKRDAGYNRVVYTIGILTGLAVATIAQLIYKNLSVNQTPVIGVITR